MWSSERLIYWATFHLAFHSSSSGRIITAKDHASIQINVAEVNDKGVMTGHNKTYAICGFIRAMVRCSVQ